MTSTLDLVWYMRTPNSQPTVTIWRPWSILLIALLFLSPLVLLLSFSDGDSLRPHCSSFLISSLYTTHSWIGDSAMKLDYYPDTDSLYIDFSSWPSVESQEV